MRNASRRLAWSVVLGLMGPVGAVAAGFEAGAAKVEITPPLGLPMYGFDSRTSGATAVLDPLYARVLVLEAGASRLALVSLDLGEPPALEWMRRLRQRVARTSGIGHVIVAATHTHSGPDIRAEYPPRESPDWETPVLERVGQAIEEAHRSRVPARIGTGHGSVLIGHNRLRPERDGSVTWFERNNTMAPTSPVDPTVSLLRVDDAAGAPIAVLVNYACHPVVFGSDHLRYSADYPGVTTALVEREMGGRTVALFLQGGDGDINPYYAVHPLNEDAERLRNWTGERLGREAARVARAVSTGEAGETSLDVAEDSVELEWRWKDEKRRADGPPRAPVVTALIDKRIALTTVPGEPFVEHQVDWRNRCPVPAALFVANANGSLGYFPTLRAAALGGYGAANAGTSVQPDGGSRLVNHALVRVYEMLGQLRGTPER